VPHDRHRVVKEFWSDGIRQQGAARSDFCVLTIKELRPCWGRSVIESPETITTERTSY
jgi:hypothetical protein